MELDKNLPDTVLQDEDTQNGQNLLGSQIVHNMFTLEVVSTGGAPTPAGTSVFTKHNWDMGMGYLWLNGWGIYHLMGGAFMAYWVGHL